MSFAELSNMLGSLGHTLQQIKEGVYHEVAEFIASKESITGLHLRDRFLRVANYGVNVGQQLADVPAIPKPEMLDGAFLSNPALISHVQFVAKLLYPYFKDEISEFKKLSGKFFVYDLLENPSAIDKSNVTAFIDYMSTSHPSLPFIIKNLYMNDEQAARRGRGQNRVAVNDVSQSAFADPAHFYTDASTPIAEPSRKEYIKVATKAQVYLLLCIEDMLQLEHFPASEEIQSVFRATIDKYSALFKTISKSELEEACIQFSQLDYDILKSYHRKGLSYDKLFGECSHIGAICTPVLGGKAALHHVMFIKDSLIVQGQLYSTFANQERTNMAKIQAVKALATASPKNMFKSTFERRANVAVDIMYNFLWFAAKNNSGLWKGVYTNPYPNDVLIRRAFWGLGEFHYGLLTDNCENILNWIFENNQSCAPSHQTVSLDKLMINHLVVQSFWKGLGSLKPMIYLNEYVLPSGKEYNGTNNARQFEALGFGGARVNHGKGGRINFPPAPNMDIKNRTRRNRKNNARQSRNKRR